MYKSRHADFNFIFTVPKKEKCSTTSTWIIVILTISPIVAIDPPNIMPTPTFQSDKNVAMTIINPHSGLLTNAG